MKWLFSIIELNRRLEQERQRNDVLACETVRLRHELISTRHLLSQTTEMWAAERERREMAESFIDSGLVSEK